MKTKELKPGKLYRTILQFNAVTVDSENDSLIKLPCFGIKKGTILMFIRSSLFTLPIKDCVGNIGRAPVLIFLHKKHLITPRWSSTLIGVSYFESVKM